MAYKTVKASWLIARFRQMETEGWRYVANAAREGEVDCSGAFAYWYQQAGSYMPHGSNSMIRKYAVRYGKIGEIELKPGMPVFRWRKWSLGDLGNTYYGDSLGNFRHVGLYIGAGLTIDARDSKTGVALGKIEDWDYAAELNYTNYDVSEQSDADVISGADAPVNEKTGFPVEAFVKTNGGSLNLRKKPSLEKTSTILKRIPFGTKLILTESKPSWYKTSFDGVKGWVSADYIEIAQPEEMKEPEDLFHRTVKVECFSEETYTALVDYMTDRGIEFFVEGGDD